MMNIQLKWQSVQNPSRKFLQSRSGYEFCIKTAFIQQNHQQGKEFNFELIHDDEVF